MEQEKINIILNEREKFLKNPLEYQTLDVFVIENFLLFDEDDLFDKANLEQYIHFLLQLDRELLPHTLNQFIKILQDLNWPGALSVFDFLVQLDKRLYIHILEQYMHLAVAEDDIEWLINMNKLIRSSNIKMNDFEDKVFVSNLKEYLDRYDD